MAYILISDPTVGLSFLVYVYCICHKKCDCAIVKIILLHDQFYFYFVHLNNLKLLYFIKTNPLKYLEQISIYDNDIEDTICRSA